ncbi:MAG: hypothetical protein HYV32_00605 [Candidatus Kerfeldbacteria bacterium]|nr:hypothetical protein [Candidatus Kerfeldbacteria bacterium]
MDIVYILFSKQIIFFIIGMFVSSCIYGLTITSNPSALLKLYALNPQESFTHVANRKKQTYTTSYTTHKRKVRIIQLLTIGSVSLLLVSLIIYFL